jgi:citrate synthase
LIFKINIKSRNTENQEIGMPQKDLMSREEVLGTLNIKAGTLYAYVSRGLIKSVPHEDGRKSMYLRSDVERVGSRTRGRAPRSAAAESSMRWGEPVLCSAITRISADGPLYRNRSAVELAQSGASFESIAQLLMTGVWQDRIAAWPASPMPDDVMPFLNTYARKIGGTDMGNLLGMTALALGMQGRGNAEISNGTAVQDARLLIQAMAGCIGFLGPKRKFAVRNAGESLAAFILRAAGGQGSPAALRALNGAMTVLADNELAPATFAARVAASTNADVFNCVACAIGSHVGFSTGTATEKIETLLLPGNAAAGSAGQRLDLVREYGASLFGFNHPLYPEKDARADLILDLVRQLDAPAAATPETLAFLQLAEESLAAHPSVAIALVVLTRALALPDGSATAIWIVSRTAGWVAHVLEQRTQAFLLRPRAKYIFTAPA